MTQRTPSEEAQVRANEAAHYGRVADRADRIPALKALLAETEKATVLAALKEGGYLEDDSLDGEELPAIKEQIQEKLIAPMEEENNKVAGLSSAIKKGLVGAAITAPEQEGTYEAQLEAAQVEWVKERVEAGYERSKVVNAPLLTVEGVPAFPEKEAVLRSALKGLTQKQVEFMMQEGRSPFTLQVKAVGPSSRLDLVEKLINGQPKKMSIPNGQAQQDLNIWSEARKHMSTRSNQSSGIVWKWDFYQSEQIIGTESWDDVTLSIEDRLAKYKAEWETAGMRGTDRWSLGTATADGLERGKPLDVRFKDDATNIEKFEEWNATILDEESELTINGYRSLVGGRFSPRGRDADLFRYFANFRNVNARFRASCDGVIKA